VKVNHTVQIDRSPEEVFAFVADFENLPRWQKSVITAHKVTEGPIRVGSKFTEDVRILGRNVESTGEVTALEPNRRMEFDLTSKGPIECKAQFTFAAAAGGTSLSLDGDFRLKGLWKLMTPMAAGEIRRETRKELEALKTVLEGSPESHTSSAPAADGGH
jgi:uncharacterized membrane protein